MSRLLFLSVGCLVVAPLGALADTDPAQQAADEQTLKSVQSGIDGPALLDFFKKRTSSDADRNQVEQLIKLLGDDEFEKREKAKQELLDRGPVVIKQLSGALKNPDLEVAHRAEECLKVLTRAADPSVAAAAVRLIAQKKPDGTVESLIAYLPFAGDEMIVEELREALAALAVRDGKPAKAVLAALDDKLAVRRAAAAEALVRSGPDDVRAGLKKLLKDEDTNVRLWTALGFLQKRDRDAVPALIDLLATLERDQAWRVEDALARIAGEKSPSVSLGTDEAGRKKCRDAWQKWWDDDGSKLDLAKVDLDDRQLGYTLLIGMELGKGINGKVQEIGQDGKVRWEISGLKYAIDARVIGHDRVLIVEYSGRCVSERNFKGEVLWKYDLNVPQFPLSAQRLPNGNTFIACRNGLLEVDRDGKEVFNLPRQNNDVLGAQKLRNGQYVVATNTGAVQFVDAEGKELKAFTPGMQAILGGGFEALPSGRVLVALMNQQKVVELDAEGKVVWEVAAKQPTQATRLANGHTLVASMYTQEVVEYDAAGKEVWKHKAEMQRLLRARRR